MIANSFGCQMWGILGRASFVLPERLLERLNLRPPQHIYIRFCGPEQSFSNLNVFKNHLKDLAKMQILIE